jgi:hypothetical protein
MSRFIVLCYTSYRFGQDRVEKRAQNTLHNNI